MTSCADRADATGGLESPAATAPHADATSGWPSVGVVVPTRERPQLVRACLASITAQDYAGRVEIVVVFDGEPPDIGLVAEFATPDRPVRVLANARPGGLAGTRNTGLAALDSELVAFCDDDDAWAPEKLTAQVTRLHASPDAEMVTCAISVSFEGRRSVRLAGQDQIRHADLISSRMSMLHSSTFLFRRRALLSGIGPPEESIPGSQNEDWDLLLRAARRAPIAHVDRPLVAVLWGQSSYFSRQWDSRVSSLHWMLEHHPEIAADRTGAARVYGQLAFGYAVQRRRGLAVQWTARSLRARWREPRGLFALAVAAGVPGEFVLARLHRQGHGI